MKNLKATHIEVEYSVAKRIVDTQTPVYAYSKGEGMYGYLVSGENDTISQILFKNNKVTVPFHCNFDYNFYLVEHENLTPIGTTIKEYSYKFHNLLRCQSIVVNNAIKITMYSVEFHLITKNNSPLSVLKYYDCVSQDLSVTQQETLHNLLNTINIEEIANFEENIDRIINESMEVVLTSDDIINLIFRKKK